jgi:hypothetical protein
MLAPQYPKWFLGIRSQTHPPFRSSLLAVGIQDKQVGNESG